MVNVLMSRRTKEDYTAVFRELIKSLNEDLNLEECVLDFELVAWVSLREVFFQIFISMAVSSTTLKRSSAESKHWD